MGGIQRREGEKKIKNNRAPWRIGYLVGSPTWLLQSPSCMGAATTRLVDDRSMNGKLSASTICEKSPEKGLRPPAAMQDRTVREELWSSSAPTARTLTNSTDRGLLSCIVPSTWYHVAPPIWPTSMFASATGQVPVQRVRSLFSSRWLRGPAQEPGPQ